MSEAERVYTLELQDILKTKQAVADTIRRGKLPEDFGGQATISESAITKYCQGCDNFVGEAIPCKLVGSNDQARHVARKWCGWASVNGQKVVRKG